MKIMYEILSGDSSDYVCVQEIFNFCIQVLVNCCVFKLPLPEFCSPEVNKNMSFYCSK